MNSNQLRKKLTDFERASTPLGTLSDPDAADLEFIKKVTAGTDFTNLAEDTLSEIHNIPQTASVFERVFSGPFGSGKTHMGLVLYQRLTSQAESNQLIITFDFSKIQKDASDLQFLIITGLRTSKGNGYQYACEHIFDRIAAKFGIKDNQQKLNVVKAIIYRVYEHAKKSTDGWLGVAGDLVERNFGDEIKAALRNQTLIKLLDQLKAQTSYEFVEFVEALSDLVANPDNYGDQFEQIVRDLAANFSLTDIIFKLIKVAGYERLIIIGDELETLSSQSTDFMTRTLTQIRSFRDSCFANADRSYPAISFLLFSTPSFLENSIKVSEPALWSRWEYCAADLPTPNIEETVHKFTELALEAQLISEPANDQEIVRTLTEQQADEEELLTMRRLIHDVFEVLHET